MSRPPTFRQRWAMALHDPWYVAMLALTALLIGFMALNYPVGLAICVAVASIPVTVRAVVNDARRARG